MLKNKTEVYTVEEYKLMRAGGLMPGETKSKNRKIMNATKVSSGGVTFDSKLEKAMYDELTSLNIEFCFKPKFVIMPGFYYQGKKVREITWTPDFFFERLNLVLDTKGFPDSKFPLKLKLFKRYCTDCGVDYSIWVVKDKRGIRDAAFFIKDCVDNQTDVKLLEKFSV